MKYNGDLMNELKKIPIQEIKRVHKTTFEKMLLLDIKTIKDLFLYFPYRYENYEVANLNLAENNEKVTIVGQVISEPILSFFGRNRSRLIFSVSVDNLIVKIIAFNRH